MFASKIYPKACHGPWETYFSVFWKFTEVAAVTSEMKNNFVCTRQDPGTAGSSVNK